MNHDRREEKKEKRFAITEGLQSLSNIDGLPATGDACGLGAGIAEENTWESVRCNCALVVLSQP